MYPNCITELINTFKLLPGVGEKSAERMVFSLLNFKNDEITAFIKNISKLQTNVSYCSNCGLLIENDICPFCDNEKRDKSILLITSAVKDVFTFEKLNKFNGLYFVLNGLISPIDGIGPDDIGISKMINIIKVNNVKEVILALKPSVTGEATMLYVSKILANLNIKVSKIAVGIPIGSDFDYIDPMTLEFSFDKRSSFI